MLMPVEALKIFMTNIYFSASHVELKHMNKHLKQLMLFEGTQKASK